MKGQETYKVSNLDMNSTYFTIPSLSIGTFLRNWSNSWSDMFSSNLPSMAARNCCWVRSPESLRSMLLKKTYCYIYSSSAPGHVGGVVASCSARSSLDRVVWVRVLASNIVFCSHSASLNPGVQMGTGEFNAGGNLAMD